MSDYSSIIIATRKTGSFSADEVSSLSGALKKICSGKYFSYLGEDFNCDFKQVAENRLLAQMSEYYYGDDEEEDEELEAEVEEDEMETLAEVIEELQKKFPDINFEAKMEAL